MRAIDLFSSATQGVTRNVQRALLTMLGIIIGVGAVVLMSAVGASMEKVILGQVSSLGAKSMVIFPGKQEGSQAQFTDGYDALTFEDLRALEQLPTVRNLAPVIFLRGRTVVGSEEGDPQVFGVRETFFRNQSISIDRGRLLTAEDDDAARPVAVVAPETVEKLFGSTDPLGQRIKIGERYLTVVGVTKPLGSQFFQSADDRIYVPFTFARNVTGQKYINYLTLEAADSFDLAFADIRELLRRRHGIDNPTNDEKKDDFIVHSSEEALTILGSVSLGLTLFITTVATISLVVGGIGIMNIMLVSVKERTREIGLRKAIGARRRDILLQFLLEAVLLTFIGGLLGMALGVSLAWFIAGIVTRFLSTYVFAVSLPSIVAALSMAAMTGLLFGIAPARQAARLQPMEALRYE